MAFAFLSPHEEVRYVLERKDIIMKTNQIMIRPMGEFKVIQRTKDAFFNATDLLKQWNQLKGMKKEVNDYFDLSSTKEFIFTSNPQLSSSASFLRLNVLSSLN